MLRKKCSKVIFSELLLNNSTINDLYLNDHYINILKNDIIEIFDELKLGEIEIKKGKLYISLKENNKIINYIEFDKTELIIDLFKERVEEIYYNLCVKIRTKESFKLCGINTNFENNFIIKLNLNKNLKDHIIFDKYNNVNKLINLDKCSYLNCVLELIKILHSNIQINYRQAIIIENILKKKQLFLNIKNSSNYLKEIDNYSDIELIIKFNPVTGSTYRSYKFNFTSIIFRFDLIQQNISY